MKKLKIGFDIGGVLSKYPEEFRTLINVFLKSPDKVEIYVISDMHDKALMLRMLKDNDLSVKEENVISSDYKTYGEYCKTKVCNELGIDIMLDDFVGYVAEGDFIRCLVMPNSRKPYYHESWKTDGSEGEFGRNKYTEFKK